MSKFNFTGLLAVAKALHETTTKDNIKAVIISDKVKDDTTIEFKNGSYIKVLSSKESARGNRAKLYPRPSEDFMLDWCIDKKILDEVLTPFCKERENNDIDGQILYVSSKGELMNNLEKDKFIRAANREYLYTSVHKQIANCIINEHYKAGIYTSNTSNLETISDILKTIIVEFEAHLRDVRPIVISKNGIEIYFKNGSYIIGRKINEGQRARRLNDIVYDALIDKDVVNCIISKMFVPYLPNDRCLLKMIGVEF